MYEIYCKLRNERGVKDADVVKETGITKSTFSDWKNGRSKPKQDKLQKIADYFGVNIEYLMTGKEPGNIKQPEPELTARDRRDIAKDLDRIMNEMTTGEDAPLCYNGEPIPESKLELLRQAIEVALEDAKKKNKVTYRPYKHKPRPEKKQASQDGE